MSRRAVLIEDLVDADRLIDLPAQPLDLLALLAGRQIPTQTFTSGLHLGHIAPQRLRRDPEIARNVGDRGAPTPRRGQARNVPRRIGPPVFVRGQWPRTFGTWSRIQLSIRS